MKEYSPRTYLKDVLAPYQKVGRPDPFERYLLDLDDADDDAIFDRLEQVRAFWDNNRTLPPPIGPLIVSLSDEHSTWEGQLADPDSRRALAAEIQSARERAEAARVRGIENALRGLHTEFGGIPAESRGEIVAIGRLAGFTSEEVEKHIDLVMRREGWRAVPLAGAKSAERLPDGIAQGLRQRLRRFADTRRQERGIDAPVRSLFEAFDLQFDTDPAICRTAIEAFARKIDEIKHGEYSAAARNVLHDALAHLTTEDEQAKYRATIQEEVGAALQGLFLELAIDNRISPKENEQLLRAAAEHGLPDRHARAVVDELFRSSEKVVEREVGQRVTLILCATCRQPAALEDGTKHCSVCGDPLLRACPNCHEETPRGDALCRHCGHSLLQQIRFDKDVREAREALIAARPTQALESATAALKIQPNAADAKTIQAEASAAVSAAAREWAAAVAEQKAGRLYAARGIIRKLNQVATDVDGPGGNSPGEALDQITAVLRGVESRLATARTLTDPLQRERTFAEVLAQVRDCAEAERELATLAPATPSGVSAELVRDGIQVLWEASRSPGVTGYAVVRGDGRAPTIRTAGLLVAETSELSHFDTTLVAGATVAYSIFALRAGATSSPAQSEPLVVALEARNLASSAGAGEVRLSWELPSATASVEVERQAGGQEPVDLVVRPDGVVDTGLENGIPCRYTVHLRYGDVRTPGVTLTAVPAEAPRAVSLSSLEPVADGVSISWKTPPVGSVAICRSLARLDLEPGTELKRDALAQFGLLLPGSGGTAMDPSPSDGVWYTPFTLSGDRAVAGTGLRWTDIPPVTDVSIQDSGHELKISWAWPPNVRHAMVTWREDREPEGPDDAGANKRHVARAAHQDVHGGAFRIGRTAEDEGLHIAVYPAQMRDGELIVGARLAPSSRAIAHPSRNRVAVAYDVKVLRGLRGRSVSVRLSGPEPHPEVVLVARPGDVLPLGADQGQPIARVGGDGLPSQIAVPMGSLPRDRPLAVRAFLAADSARMSYTLREPADLASLVLR